MATDFSKTARLTHLLQFSDSAFPVGTFSFSNGLETASYENMVHNAESLLQYARSASIQAAFSDGVAALHAFRAAADNDYERIKRIDAYLTLFKMNDEARTMLSRMGKKLAELGVRLFDDELMKTWLADIDASKSPGNYPVAQGIIFHRAGLGEDELFASHQFGVINMILGAALRCVRVSHYETQDAVTELAGEIPALYEAAKGMQLEDMHCFVPEMDILASLHEKGKMRMFMS